MFKHGLAVRPGTIRRVEQEARALGMPPGAFADKVLSSFLDDLRSARMKRREEARRIAAAAEVKT
jgi:hypothetical protein